MHDEISLLLFTTDETLGRQAILAGIRHLVVDWEYRGKEARQQSFDTEINRDSPEDLRRMSLLEPQRLFCRINRFEQELSAAEVEVALAAGATDLLLPMVESPREVEQYLRLVDDRARAGILVETPAACAEARALAALEPDSAYVGLNDLAIARGSRSIFAALVDGTVEKLREAFASTDFGFGGLTVIDGGAPVPCVRLLEEMARLRCAFSFVRRSFKRDIVGRDIGIEVARIQRAWRALRSRGESERRRDHLRLCSAVRELQAPPELPQQEHAKTPERKE